MNELPNLTLATRPAADACHPEKDQGSLGQGTNLTEETRPWGQHDQLEDDAAKGTLSGGGAPSRVAPCRQGPASAA